MALRNRGKQLAIVNESRLVARIGFDELQFALTAGGFRLSLQTLYEIGQFDDV
jgi:hypothetical protein